MIGHLIDRRYLITQRLSSGGFGETYLAQDTRFPGNPLCVVKQLKPASNNPKHIAKAQQLFNREAEALAQLGSEKQIPRLLAYFTEGEDFYLVQEFVEGHTLEAELQPEQRWLEEQVIQLLREVLKILVYVHAQGVIHRDIKPANIMRRQQDNSLVLIDFGAIKQVRIQPDGSGEFSLAAPGTRIGTVGYMPTEQARGKPRPCSDIYALGMIGIQALTGLYPTQLEDDSQTGEIRWHHLVKTSPGLIEVLDRMTRYQFRDRFQTAAEALQALEETLQKAPPVSAPLPVADPTLIPELVHELTLQWVEGGQAHSQIISPQQPSRQAGRIRIGRDPVRCDIVLSDITVSGLHVEIFFNTHDRSFYVRNLRETNPPLVDGQLLTYGERQLSQGSTLRLGHIDLHVSMIVLRQYPPGQLPLNAQLPTPKPEPLIPTAKSANPGIYPGVPHSPSYPPAYPSPPDFAAQPLGVLPPQPSQPPQPPAAHSTDDRANAGKNFWALWVLATVVSFVMTGFMFQTGRGFLDLTDPSFNGVINAIIGLVIGAAQWLVLQMVISRSTGWILASGVGLSLGAFIGQPFPPFVRGGVVGGILGLSQWMILRQKQSRAAWWIPVQMICYGGIWLSPGAIEGLVPRLIVNALIYGAITGGALLWIVRRSEE
ncbi:protein kinase domain-containing protein [Egbenema bharatensis]|uniref:protein kinase domain-containing protein n=1 Tax=Egbenema bharatensis TaxID=3463334 RepID=UPI003A875440